MRWERGIDSRKSPFTRVNITRGGRQKEACLYHQHGLSLLVWPANLQTAPHHTPPKGSTQFGFVVLSFANTIIQTHHLVLGWRPFGSNDSLRSTCEWRYNLGTLFFCLVLPFFFLSELFMLNKLERAGSVHSHFQVFSELLYWVQIWTRTCSEATPMFSECYALGHGLGEL